MFGNIGRNGGILQMDKREVLEKVRKFSEMVIEKYHPVKIVLFGSYARGDFRDESDIDIAVIVDK